MARPLKRIRTLEEALANRVRVERYRMQRDAARAEAARKLVRFRYLRGDLHMHTVYSDGWGGVADMAATAVARGLDFIFITDHGTIRQKVECARLKNVWWGQEPGAGPHHLCILDNTRRFAASGDIARDAARLRASGWFFFYPHPTGWFPATWYNQAQKDALRQAGAEFAIEVMNGIFRVEAFHDEWTDANVALWDDYLRRGFRVIGLGATDAHFPAGVGNVWTGVLGARRSRRSVIAALRRGNVFASVGPVINLTSGEAPMGATVRPRGGKVEVELECADSYGLSWARLLRNGREVRRWECRGACLLRRRLALRCVPGDFVRAECAARDDRRAYANPLYVR